MLQRHRKKNQIWRFLGLVYTGKTCHSYSLSRGFSAVEFNANGLKSKTNQLLGKKKNQRKNQSFSQKCIYVKYYSRPNPGQGCFARRRRDYSVWATQKLERILAAFEEFFESTDDAFERTTYWLVTAGKESLQGLEIRIEASRVFQAIDGKTIVWNQIKALSAPDPKVSPLCSFLQRRPKNSSKRYKLSPRKVCRGLPRQLFETILEKFCFCFRLDRTSNRPQTWKLPSGAIFSKERSKRFTASEELRNKGG